MLFVDVPAGLQADKSVPEGFSHRYLPGARPGLPTKNVLAHLDISNIEVVLPPETIRRFIEVGQ